MQNQRLSKYATKMFKHGFRNAFYIGRAQIYGEEYDRRPHKFFYIGYRDAFGVAMPEAKGKWSYQVWGPEWVVGRNDKLDKAVKRAMNGKFPEVRHNVQLRMRAESHGQGIFIRPRWLHKEKALATTQETEKLPTRGKRRKRRKLLV